MGPHINSRAALPIAAFAIADSEPSYAIGGIATLVFAAVFVGFLCWLVFGLVLDAWRDRRAQAAVSDPHTLMVHGLGTTMADGGEPVDTEKDSKRK